MKHFDNIMYKNITTHYMFKAPRNKFLYFDYFVRYRHLQHKKSFNNYVWEWVMIIYKLDLVSDIKVLLLDKLIKLTIPD